GSPVYVDGHLVGALSTGFSFTREPVFGITPIGEMFETLDHPERSRDGDPGTGVGGVESSDTRSAPPRYRELRWAGDESEAPPAGAANPPAPIGASAPLALPLACGGLNPAAAALAREWLAPLGLTAVPGGQARDGGPAPETLEPGS